MGINHTTTVRLPEHIRLRLEQTAQAMRRTRSSLMIEALEVHLEALQDVIPQTQPQDRYANLLRYKSSAAHAGGRNAAEIDAILHDIRGDD